MDTFEIGDEIRIVGDWDFRGKEGEVIDKQKGGKRYDATYRVDLNNMTLWMSARDLEHLDSDEDT